MQYLLSLVASLLNNNNATFTLLYNSLLLSITRLINAILSLNPFSKKILLA
jgi:hypothetical protein